MNFSTPENAFRRFLVESVRSACELDLAPDEIPLTYPPNAELGDLASPVCFELARRVRRAPRDIALAIVERFGEDPEIARLEVAGGGYINAFVDRDRFLRGWLAEVAADPEPAGAGKIIVEHTNINPNKAAHIGHLRNAVLGDTLVRFLRSLGDHVEVQNYIDDTGVQVADLVVGFTVLRDEGFDDVKRRYDAGSLAARGERFDYIAWDLYAEVTRFYEEDPERRRHRAETLHAMEQGDNPTAELAAWVARRMVEHHLGTMHRIGVSYDVLPHESDILRLDFWADAFERLKASGAIHLAERGKNAGCWVMDLPGVDEGAGEDQKVIVRSDGTVTYVGKDIAYQMWKFGLLGRDFLYRPFAWNTSPAPYALWTSCSSDGAGEHPEFGGGRAVYNVIDTRQSYLQRVVQLALRSLGHDGEAERSIHFAYEMVALTPAAVLAMFPDKKLSDEERAKPYLEMAGRRGLGIRADDLLDTLERRAFDEVRRRNEDSPESTVLATARMISVGALRYYMLRHSRNRVVAFDLDAALSFEGETGPYLQYSVVRARNILAKLSQRHGDDETDAARLAGAASLADLDPDTLADHWNLALQISRTPAVVRQAVDSLELSAVAKHAYLMAQAFNSFYHKYPVAQEERETVRRTRAALVRLYHDALVRILVLMGIEVPDRM